MWVIRVIKDFIKIAFGVSKHPVNQPVEIIILWDSR